MYWLFTYQKWHSCNSLINQTMDFADNEHLLLEYCNTKSVNLRNQIVQQNMGLVFNIAHKMKSCCTTPFEDLVQIGVTGLIKAVERFDPAKKRKLSSLAVPFINGAILQFVRDKGRLIKVPRKLQEVHQRIKRYAQKHGVTYQQAASELDVLPEIAKEAALSCNQINLELPDTLTVEQQEELRSVFPLLSKLTTLQSAILEGLYLKRTPVRILAQTHGIKFGEVRRIEREALHQLRAIVAGRVQCPKCKSYETIKYGKRRGHTCYQCKSCKYQFIENPLPIGRQGYGDDIKIKAVLAMEQGKSSYWCETYLGIDHNTAFQWSKRYAINDLMNLTIKRMVVQQQWQITDKFTQLANSLVKICPNCPELEGALKLLNESMQQAHKSLDASKK